MAMKSPVIAGLVLGVSFVVGSLIIMVFSMAFDDLTLTTQDLLGVLTLIVAVVTFFLTALAIGFAYVLHRQNADYKQHYVETVAAFLKSNQEEINRIRDQQIEKYESLLNEGTKALEKEARERIQKEIDTLKAEKKAPAPIPLASIAGYADAYRHLTVPTSSLLSTLESYREAQNAFAKSLGSFTRVSAEVKTPSHDAKKDSP